MPGKQWGAANPPINVPLDTRRLSKMAFRTNAGEFFLGDREWARHVRNNGCFACPIRCYPVIKDTATAAKFNVNPITEQTCGGLLFPIFFYPNLKNHPERNIEIAIVGSQLMDDLGLWCNYGQLQRDMIVMYQDGYWKKLLSEEYDSLPGRRLTMWTPPQCRISSRESLIAKANSASGSAKRRLSCSTTSVFL